MKNHNPKIKLVVHCYLNEWYITLVAKNGVMVMESVPYKCRCQALTVAISLSEQINLPIIVEEKLIDES